MTEKFNFWEEIEDELDKQFPKGKCKERGNALVLNAIFHLNFEKFIKILKEELCTDGKRRSRKVIKETIDKLVGKNK